MSHNLELANRPTACNGFGSQQATLPDPALALDARFEALDQLIRASSDVDAAGAEPGAALTDANPRKLRRRVSRRVLAAAVSRALWKLAADPSTVAMIQEAIAAEPQPVRSSASTNYAEVLRLLSAQSGFRPLPLHPRHPVGNAFGVIDESLGRLVMVVESAPDGSARFRLPTARSERLESILAATFGPAATFSQV